MGFGYLFVGYLITFVLYLTVQALGLGGMTLLAGYGVMMLGLFELSRYQRAFSYAKWMCIPLMLTAVYQSLGDLSSMFSWNAPFLGASVSNAVMWVQFMLVIVFQMAMLYAIRVIGSDVGLSHISTKALRNCVFVGLYAIIYLLTNLVFAQNEEFRKYFVFSLMLSQAVVILFNLLLLISCTKNICAEGQDDAPPKPHRFAFLNKMDALYDRTRQRSIDQARADGAAFAEKRRKKKEQKKNRKH